MPDAAPAPVREYVVPAPVPDPAIYAAPAPVTESVDFAPVTESVAPATVLSDLLETPVPDVQAAQVPHVQFIVKAVVIPEVQSGRDTRTSVSLGAAPVRRVKFAETESPLPAAPAPLLHVTAPVVDAPPVVVEREPPAPMVELVAPSPAVAHAAPALVVLLDVPVPAVA